MDSPSNDNTAGIGSIRIVATGLLHGPVELALIVNEGTPAEMRLGTKDLYDTGFLHAIITEAREHIERHQASAAGRYREPTPRCQLCGVGQGAERERLADFARNVMATQGGRDDRVV